MGADTHITSPKDNTPANTNPMGGGPVSTIPDKKEQLQPTTTQAQNNDSIETKQVVKQTQQEKLKQVKDLYDKGLITKEIYIERQRKILEGN
jgi:hypothetical protein